MIRKLSFLILLAAPQVFAANTYFRGNGDTSVVLRRACAYELDGVERLATLDFDTTSLSIVITASGDGVDTTFTYTGGNLDDYDGTPPAWGNPTTAALEVEAAGDCVNLHIRDEVFAVSGATEWTIEFTDGGTAILDQELTVLHVETATDIATAVATELDDGAAFTEAGGTGDHFTALAGVILSSSTCDSGTTTTCVDAALTQANDIWKGVAIVFPTLGETSCVYDFVAATDTLTFWALQTDIGTEAFYLVESAICESATDETP